MKPKITKIIYPKLLAKVKDADNLVNLQKSFLNSFKSFRQTTKDIKGLRTSGMMPYSKMVTGNTGAQNLRRLMKERKAAGIAAISARGSYPIAPIDRAVNARAKGIVFRRVNGRIIPMRKK